MTEITVNIISALLIGGTILYLFVLLIVAKIRYASFMQAAKKLKPDFKEDLGRLWGANSGGDWVAGEYWFRAPLPIEIKSQHEELSKLAAPHNKVIKLFWISVLILLPLLTIVLNLMN